MGICYRKMIGRELLWLACSQNIIKLILAKFFILFSGPSSSPYISIFKGFKTAWENVTHDKFRGLVDVRYRCSAVEMNLLHLLLGTHFECAKTDYLYCFLAANMLLTRHKYCFYNGNFVMLSYYIITITRR